MSATSKFTFPGSQGDELAARLDLPDRAPRAIALFAHCFTCGKDIAAASRISKGLVDAGIGVLRFDFTGLGSSEGEFANTNFTSNVDDLIAAADMLRRRHEAPTLLIGHSLGGAAVLAAAPRIPEVRAVATLAAPSDPAHVRGVFTDATLAEIDETGEAAVDLAGRPFRIRRQFLDDIASQKIADSVRSMDAALLVLHSPVDQLVDIDHARRIYAEARHPKSFVTVDGADHLLTNRDDAIYVATIIATWASRYLVPVSDDRPAARPPLAGTITVDEDGPDAFSQTVRAGHHTFTADEPLGIGDDTGPNPYDLLLAALGTCTSMTLRMYAKRKGLPLDHVRVSLSHDRTHSDDCADPIEAPCKVEVIERRIDLTGDLSDEQIDSLTAIADKCPVHRTLEADLRVSTSVNGR